MGGGQPAGGEAPHGRELEGEVKKIEGDKLLNIFTSQRRKIMKCLEGFEKLSPQPITLLVCLSESPGKTILLPVTILLNSFQQQA